VHRPILAVRRTREVSSTHIAWDSPDVWRMVADRLVRRTSQSVSRVDLRLVGTRSR